MYMIYRVDSLLSAGVVSMRQHALLLYARAYYTCTYPCTHTYIYKCITSWGHIHIRTRASARECACTCTWRTRACAHRHACTLARVGPTTHAHTHPRMNSHACARTRANAPAHVCMRTHTRDAQHAGTCMHAPAQCTCNLTNCYISLSD